MFFGEKLFPLLTHKIFPSSDKLSGTILQSGNFDNRFLPILQVCVEILKCVTRIIPKFRKEKNEKGNEKYYLYTVKCKELETTEVIVFGHIFS